MDGDVMWKFYKRKDLLICVVTKDQLYPVLYMYHNDPTAGHLSDKKMFLKLKDRFYWPQMFEDIRQYVQSCHECQVKKPLVRVNELHPIPPG